jgi:pimeloyl-ACP methyl ester carboxylesterase
VPIITFPRFLFSLVSLAIVAAAIYFAWGWAQGYDVMYRDGTTRHFRGETWRLFTALAFGAWSVLGRVVVLMFIPGGCDDPREERAEANLVSSADGSVLHVETTGATGGHTIVLTHGWGLNSTAWWYTKRALSGRYRVVVWDLPGLGRSRPPKDGKLTIDRFAAALGTVVRSTGRRPVILVGHSIGGMTTQTFWRACSKDLREQVAGIVLVDTTHENPLRTMWLSKLWQFLRWPLIEPMSYLTILLSPVVWISSWQGYLSGSNQLAMRLTGFGRFATRGQVDFTARLACKGSPGIQAKGNLAMFRWKATDVLAAIDVPILVLTGTNDIVTLSSASDMIANAAPCARVIRVEAAGHMGFMERAEIYNEAIAAFAEEVFATSVSASAMWSNRP